jgi:hypothetical protein
VPEDYFFINGVCLCVTVLDHDIVSYNDLAGQAMYPLASIAKLKSLSSKHLPKPIVLPLIFPSHPLQYDEHFQVNLKVFGHIEGDIFRYWKNAATKTTNWLGKLYVMNVICVHIEFFRHVPKMIKSIALERQATVAK